MNESQIKNSNKNILLCVNCLKLMLTIFTSTFFTSYIISFDTANILGKGLFKVAAFYISQYFFYILLYIIISKFLTKLNKVKSFRVGIIINGVLLITIVLFGNNISKWIVLASMLIGFSDAFYNSNYLVLKNDSVKYKKINNFNMITSVLTNLINIIVPTVLGCLIDVTSFSYVSVYIVAVVVVQLVLTYFLKPQQATHDFNVKKYIKILREDKFAWSKIKYTYFNAIFAGFKNTYKVVIVVLTIYIFKTNLSLGILTSVFSIITTLLLLLFKKFEYHKRMNRLAVYIVVSLLPFISAILFVSCGHKITLIILNLSLNIAMQLSEYIGNCERDTIIKNLKLKEFIPEHQFLVEFCMCACRVFSYILFLVVGLLENIVLFKILLLIMILMNVFKYMIMYKQHLVRKELEKLFNKDNDLYVSEQSLLKK